jgi:putative glutamine amidotransferase
VLNVALGGTLVQDIPSQITHPLAHGQPSTEPRDRIAHTVALVSGSRLAGILEQVVDADGVCPVNSRHHQAVKDPGDGLVVTATSSDGVVEAAERPASRFCVGVQWHPENFRTRSEFGALFDSFVRAAR